MVGNIFYNRANPFLQCEWSVILFCKPFRSLYKFHENRDTTDTSGYISKSTLFKWSWSPSLGLHICLAIRIHTGPRGVLYSQCVMYIYVYTIYIHADKIIKMNKLDTYSSARLRVYIGTKAQLFWEDSYRYLESTFQKCWKSQVCHHHYRNGTEAFHRHFYSMHQPYKKLNTRC